MFLLNNISHPNRLTIILQGILWSSTLDANFSFGSSLVFLLIFIYTLICENGNRTLDRTMACSGNGAYDCLTNEMEKEKVFLFFAWQLIAQALSSVLHLPTTSRQPIWLFIGSVFIWHMYLGNGEMGELHDGNASWFVFRWYLPALVRFLNIPDAHCPGLVL